MDKMPPWKQIWYPLSLGQVFLVFLVAQILAAIPIVALRELAHLPLPEWTIGGLGGLLGFFGARWMALRKLAAR